MLLVGCKVDATVTPTPLPTATLPPPQVYTTHVPDAEIAVRAFLEGWKSEDYPSMYALLSLESQQAVDQDAFVKRYIDVTNEAALSEINYEILSVTHDPSEGQAAYRATLRSSIIGDIVREMTMPLVLQNGVWRVVWNETMILPELAGGNYLSMDPIIPQRGTIYDRNGNPLAEQREAIAIGVYPGYVDLAEPEGLISLLSTLTGHATHTISTWIEEAGAGDYLPLGEIPSDLDPRRVEILSGYGAAQVSTYNSRLYYGNGIGPQIIGYVSPIQEDEVELFRRQGYRSDERVGRRGLEKWGEQILGGTRGGTLYVFSPDGKPVGQIGSINAQPGQEIYTTLDGDFQKGAQQALGSFRGALVVLELDTGRVLAMASSPGFDPNAFEIANINWNVELSNIVNNPDSPQFNRAAEGLYPLGSVFKIITAAAGLESERYTAETTYQCGYVFEELSNFPRYDWTYERFQNDGTTQPSGLLTFPEGLIRSCNPFFWHIGLDLYNAGLTTAISDMARGFGLGSATGIVGVDEEFGTVPDPQSQVDAINLAIGQGDLQVTPLQVARFVAAVGNGGTLYYPRVIEKIAPPGGAATFSFTPEISGTLPVSPENLAIIQEAMKGVVRSQNPVGTAYTAFNGLEISVAGKTGTATTGDADPHAWFAGYTFEGREDKPDIAAVVIIENVGDGSVFAAPVFRRLVELYFFGAPRKLYRWEAAINVTRSPTPIVTDTPTPSPGEIINPP